MKSQSTLMKSESGRVFRYARRVALSAPSKLLLAAVLMFTLMSVLPATGGQGQNEKRTLTANWLVTVTRLNPAPGQAPTFLSLMTYFEDGNLLEESNSSSIRSAGRGNWERIGHQQFTRSFVFFRFDSARNYLGTGENTTTITLSEDGSEFQANAVTRIFDGSGNLVNTLQFTEVGQRL